MPVALHVELDKHLNKALGSTTAYTVTGAVATLPTASLSYAQLEELIRVAKVLKHDVKLNAGVLTVTPL